MKNSYEIVNQYDGDLFQEIVQLASASVINAHINDETAVKIAAGIEEDMMFVVAKIIKKEKLL